jgi:hypothetical protein
MELHNDVPHDLVAIDFYGHDRSEYISASVLSAML